MRNDRQGRRIEIGGKAARGGEATGQDDDPDCVGKEHRQDIIHLQGIILLLAGSQKARARARALYILFLSFPLASTLLPPFLLLYSAGGKIAVRNRRYHCSAGREREKDPARNKGAAIGAAAPRRDEAPFPPAVHLSVNRRPSGKLPALSVHREQLRGSSFFLVIVRRSSGPFARVTRPSR